MCTYSVKYSGIAFLHGIFVLVETKGTYGDCCQLESGLSLKLFFFAVVFFLLFFSSCLPPSLAQTMRVIVLSAVILLYVRAEPKSKTCAARCDVSACPSPSCPSGYVPDRCGCCLVCARAEGESCGRAHDLPCGDGLECKHPAGKRLSKGVCQCRYGAKVCASDGNTYADVCQLKAASRKALQQGLPGLSSVHKGPCESGRGKLSLCHA